MRSRIDDVLQQAVQAAGLTGAVAMAATRGGMIHSLAVGERDRDSPMALDSLVRIASMTKAITSAVALRLVERGQLDLDDPICDVLTELTEPMVFERFGVDGRPILNPGRTLVTLRHLLTHTAGYGYDTWNQPMGHIQATLQLPRVPTGSDELRRVPLLFEPGTQWNYGINTDIVGRACEVVTGQRLDELIRTEITEPLGMADTMFLPGPDQEARRMAVHQRGPEDSLVRLDLTVASELPFLAGGGMLLSTAPDYMKFLQAVLSGTILGPEMFEAFTTAQTGDISVVPMISAVPAMSNDVVLYPDQALKWSLGFMVNTEQTAEGRSAGSLAWAGLYNSYYWIDLHRGVCGVFITQLLPFADPATLHAFRDYEKAIYDSLA
jgi:CubicO group peptidase (beta-lactamase class C family)